MRDLKKIRKKFGMYGGVEGSDEKLELSDAPVGIEDIAEGLEGMGLISLASKSNLDLYLASVGCIKENELDYTLEDVRQLMSDLLEKGIPKEATDYLRWDVSNVYIPALINNIAKPDSIIDLEVDGKILLFDYLGQSCRDVRFNIRGDVGENLGRSSDDCSFVVEGNVGHRAGEGSQTSSYRITGRAATCLGKKSHSCNFKVGSVDKFAGKEAINSKFEIEKDAVSSAGAFSELCRFDIGGRLDLVTGVGDGTGFYRNGKLLYPKKRHRVLRKIFGSRWS